MSTPIASFDKATALDVRIRIGDAQSITFIFTDEDGADYDISGIEWEANFKKSAGYEEDVLHFTEGTGLTIGGTNNRSLTISIDEDDSSQPEFLIYWELKDLTNNRKLFVGNADFVSGPYGSVTSTEEVTINTGEQVINVTIQGSGLVDEIDGGSL